MPALLAAEHLNPGGGLIADLDRLGPVLVVMVTAGIILLADLVLPRDRVRWLASLAVAGLGASSLWLLQLILRDRWASYFSDSMAFDDFSVFFSLLFLAVCGAVIIASLDYLGRFGKHQAEFLALTLIATAGMMLLASSRDLVSIFVALELTAITQFILAGLLRDDRGTEAAIKYLLIGAVSSAVILYGMAFLYGLAGTTRLITSDGAPSIADAIQAGGSDTRAAIIVAMVFLAAGLGYKMATVPFQMWTPDVYQASPVPVAAFLSVGSKAAAFAVVLRIFFEGFAGGAGFVEDWKILFGILAAISMIVGNVMAVRQSNIRRMLGYSSIAQAGNFLVGIAAVTSTSEGDALGASAVVFFVATYAFTNLGAFFAVMAISNRTGNDEIDAYAGLGRRAPVAAAVLTLCLLSLTGLPPTAGFWAKLFVFNAAVQADLVWLVVIAVLNTAISAFYYLGVARQMYAAPPASEAEFKQPLPMQAALLAAAAGVFAFFVYPYPLLDAAQRAVQGFA
jgi:NADH-quinone oxidoreductase subunit N